MIRVLALMGRILLGLFLLGAGAAFAQPIGSVFAWGTSDLTARSLDTLGECA